jgi:RND family efflux transporter MFP subunit
MEASLPVHVDAAGSSLDARVSEIAPSASAGSRTFLVKLDLPADPKLRAGQFGRLRLPVQERPAVMIPQSALVRRGQVESVFVINDGIARLRLVKSGRLLDGQIEILSGLSGQETVVTADAALLSDGKPVEVAP